MRRLAIFVLLLSACGAHHASTPAWPKMAAREADGGESLAPRAGATATAVAAADDDDDDIKVVVTPAVPAADKPAAEKPAATPAAATPEEPIQIDDIVIEIDD